MYLTAEERVVAQSALLDAMIMHFRWYLSHREHGERQAALRNLQDVREYERLYRKLVGRSIYGYLKKQIDVKG